MRYLRFIKRDRLDVIAGVGTMGPNVNLDRHDLSNQIERPKGNANGVVHGQVLVTVVCLG
jgi:hypothetical protein